MNLATALKEIGAARDYLPVEALRWLRDNWSAGGPAAAQVLSRCARDPEEAADRDMIAGYFLLHLAAEKRDSSVASLALRLAKDPTGLPAIMGDAIGFTLTPMLIAFFSGNPDALREIVLAPEADGDVKAAALAAHAFAAVSGATDRHAATSWLKTLPTRWKSADEDEACLDGFAYACALLGDEDLAFLARQAFDEGRIPEELLAREEFEDLFRVAREEPDPLAPFEREGIAPLTDAIEALARVEAAIEEAQRNAPEDYEPAEGGGEVETVVNPNRDVGRNDPCPCGSGKKYKKCCLAA